MRSRCRRERHNDADRGDEVQKHLRTAVIFYLVFLVVLAKAGIYGVESTVTKGVFRRHNRKILR